jgi:hypothetical protein
MHRKPKSPDDAARILRQAVDRHYPRLALLLDGAPREAELAALVARVAPRVRRISRLRDRSLEIVLTSRIRAVAERGADGVIRVNPLAARVTA